MMYQNKVAFEMGTSRSVGVAIAERLVGHKHEASINHGDYGATAEASSPRTAASGGQALIIQEDVDVGSALGAPRGRMTVVFERVGVFIGGANINLPSKLIAETYDVVVRIHRGTAGDSLIEAAASIFEMALTIERDLETVAYWYCSDPIAVLGGRTALQLVEKGESLRVLKFLESVKAGEAD